MDSCNREKRLFTGRSDQQEVSNNETDRVEAKRQRRVLGKAEDEFEEFVALLDRIEFMKTKHPDQLGIWEAISMQRTEDFDIQVLKTKSPWIPSFEWEDFAVSAAKNTMFAQMGIGKNNLSRSEEKGNQSIQPANQFKTPHLSRDASGNVRAQSFDLNVEAASW